VFLFVCVDKADKIEERFEGFLLRYEYGRAAMKKLVLFV
jgi:hypothetical protein